MVEELVKAGFTGEGLIKELMRHGYSRTDAEQEVAFATGDPEAEDVRQERPGLEELSRE